MLTATKTAGSSSFFQEYTIFYYFSPLDKHDIALEPGFWYTFTMFGEEFQLIDNHIHLQDEAFIEDLDALLDQGRQAGVARFCCNGTSPVDWPLVAQIASDHSDVIPSFGVHPWMVNELESNWFENLCNFLDIHPAAIGEIGLDRWITPRDEALQETIFRKQLQLAQKRSLPVSVHCLRAWDWLLKIFKEETLPEKILIHAFGGSKELINPLLDKGCYFSFGGSLFRKEKEKLRQAFTAVPLERLMLETDAPDIPPPKSLNVNKTIKRKGQLRNEPANLRAFLTNGAELLNMPAASLAEVLWKNAEDFWGDLLR